MPVRASYTMFFGDPFAVRFKQTRIEWLICGMVVVLSGTSAQGDLLATYPILFTGGGADVYTSISHRTYISESFNDLEGYGSLFEEIIVYDGETVIDVADVSNDPEFPIFTDRLTDGLDWWLYDGVRLLDSLSYRGAFDLESLRYDFVDPDHTGPDLAGNMIDSVVRTITVQLETPGSDPNGDGNWTDFSITGQFEIHGHPIPEPATLTLLMAGAGAYIRKKPRA